MASRHLSPIRLHSQKTPSNLGHTREQELTVYVFTVILLFLIAATLFLVWQQVNHP